MTIQNFNLYTAKGYAGELVDSGPRVIQTGIVEDANTAEGYAIGFGKAVKRGVSERGVALGAAADVFAISQREYNHEANSIPSSGNDTGYKSTYSASLIRQGYLYIEVTDTAASIGEKLSVDTVTGEFAGGGISSGNFVVSNNVVAEQAGVVGDIIKVRLDIV
tara:strand:- start:93 stop:581 length:489 start_codon:yes stop_codon:yes gene_type:complete